MILITVLRRNLFLKIISLFLHGVVDVTNWVNQGINTSYKKGSEPEEKSKIVIITYRLSMLIYVLVRQLAQRTYVKVILYSVPAATDSLFSLLMFRLDRQDYFFYSHLEFDVWKIIGNVSMCEIACSLLFPPNERTNSRQTDRQTDVFFVRSVLSVLLDQFA